MSALPKPPAPEPARNPIPPLENGDRLTRVEFERRYNAMPWVKKAELIEGIVYMPSPVRVNRHGKPHIVLSTWLGYYLSKTPGLEDYGDNSTARLDEDNEPQPDLALLLPKKLGGLARVDDDDYFCGPPTWVAEIAASGASIDLHAKLNAYRRNGVKEYLVWRTNDAAVDWFTLREGQYLPLAPDQCGILRSEQFPGLWLNVSALLKGDLQGLFQAIDQAAASPEHLAFVQKLAAR